MGRIRPATRKEISVITTEARAPYAERKAPWLARIIAMGNHIYWEGWNRTSIRAPYGEVSFGYRLFAFSLGSHGRPYLHVALPGIQVFFRLPHWRWLEHLTRGPHDMDRRSYGFSWRFGPDWQGDIHAHWGTKFCIISMPWGWNKHRDDYRREYLGTDGVWHDQRQFPHEWIAPENRGPEPVSITEPYPYLTKYGVFQGDITATAHMERTQLVYRILGFPVRRMVKFSIDVKFSKEVGSQRGSWKGGTVGTGFDMKPGETIAQTLHRMRRERSFCR
jgi:hypothetical protein